MIALKVIPAGVGKHQNQNTSLTVILNGANTIKKVTDVTITGDLKGDKMSREIKFRAWDKIERIMVYPYSLHFNSSNTLSYCIFPDMKEHREFEIEQYTGLKDKNGKEIYEGDIVREIDNELPVSQIAWDNSFSGFTLKEADLLMDLDFKNLFEVIGNIHENKEILK